MIVLLVAKSLTDHEPIPEDDYPLEKVGNYARLAKEVN